MKNSFQKEPLFMLYTLITVLVILFYAILPRSDFSARENRRLTASPSLDRHIAESLHSYMNDHFPFREQLVGVAATLKSYLLGGESNGVIRSEDFLTERRDFFDNVLFAKNLETLSSFAEENGLPFTRLLLPHPADFLGDDGGLYASPIGKELRTLLSEESTVRPASLTRKDYYRTDHHLNERGIEKIMTPLFMALGKTPPAVKEKEALSGFLGSAYRKSGLLSFPSEVLYLPHFAGEDTVEIYTENGERLPLYDEKYKKSGDLYSVFLGGNYPVLYMKNGKNTRETLLVVKDSYANAVFPYLLRSFDIVAIDPRYFRGNLNEVQETAGASHLLLLAGGDLLASVGCSFYYE